MKALKILGICCLGLWMTGCNGEQSLQEYYVANQENKDFLAVDVPASLLANSESLSTEQRKTLETIKKVNILAIPKKAENMGTINTEREKVASILKDEKYQLLMRFGSGETKMELYFTGNEEAVDEVIVYGFNDTRGLGIARILGKNMNPADIMELLQSLQKGDLNVEGLQSITSMFVEEAEEAKEPEVVE